MNAARTIALVGGAGFLGRCFATHAARVGKTIVIDLPERLAAMPAFDVEIESRPADIGTDPGLPDALRGVTDVVHLAWASYPGASENDPVRDATNIVNSVRLLRACEAAGVARFIFASSGGAIYGDVDKTPVQEHAPTRPLSAYGVSKLAVEEYVRHFARRSSLIGISLRIGNPYGPYQLGGTPVGVIAYIVRNASLRETIFIWGDGSVARDFIYVEDVGKAVESALRTTTLPSGSYNIGSGVMTSINEIIRKVESQIGESINVKYESGRSFDVGGIALDSTSFFSLTGWKPTVALNEGLEKMWQSIQGSDRSDTAGFARRE